MRSVYCLLVALAATHLPENATASEPAKIDLETGKAHKRPVDLTVETFQAALEDPANPVWLLKFYAPWCGHCKRLVPVLNAVAKLTEGKMAIGKIDCTTEKKLCDQHGVRGFPTLKVSLDGDIHDYPGGRKKEEFLDFAEKMNRPAVDSVSSTELAVERVTKNTETGVAFVVYHSAVQGSTMENKLQSTLLTQVVAQVARKQRAYAEFMLLELDEEEEKEKQAPFFCRLEMHVEPRCYEDMAGVNTVDLLNFVREQNVPTVSHLGPSNFHKLGRNGRPLVIGVVDGQDADQVSKMKETLAKYAVAGDANLRDKYYYGWFDGKVWQKFLEQFDVLPEDSPQIFCLNVPKKQYWQNATYKLNVDDFLADVADGTIERKSAGKKGFDGVLQKLYFAIVEYQPWSIIFLIILGISVAVAIATVVSPGDDLRPPYTPSYKKAEVAAKAEAEAAASGGTEKDEKKKDK
jgi:protein disulfide-isomerase-like protein